MLKPFTAESFRRQAIPLMVAAYILVQGAFMSSPIARNFGFLVSDEALRAAILVSILSVWVLIGLFTYLNRYTKRRYFSLWTVAWLFYAVWLSLNHGLVKLPDTPLVTTVEKSCLGISATFLLWGSFRFLALRVRQTLLGLFMGFLVVWSYIGSYHLEKQLAMDLPIFGLIGLASILTAVCFFQYRRRRPFIGATLLTAGFFLWGLFFANYPFFQETEQLSASGFYISAVLQLFIAVSMIILVLEEVRNANHSVLDKVRSHQSENELLKTRVASTEERYRSLFDQASEAIIITAADDFRILELNATAQRLLGINRAEAAKHFLTSFCQATMPGCIIPKGGKEWFTWVCRQPNLRLVRKNGGSVQTEVDGSTVDFDGKRAYQFFFRELTERTKLEQQLRQAEKLSALGQMISGVAHELNNPLAVIKGYLELVLSRHNLPAETRADLQKVSSESVRAAKLVRNFLAFAHDQPAQREMTNLNEIVERVAELRKFEMGKLDVGLELQLQAGLPETHADPDQVQQIITNLMTNSIQAMQGRPKPHRLRIRSEQKSEDTILVVIEDNGPGVPAELEHKIFEPFFTTKGVGTGTGLGLSIAHSIMTEHGGRIYYQPSPLGGASFLLEFHIVKIETKPTLPGRGTTLTVENDRRPQPAEILVLDDEQAIAELLGEMLTALGHQATVCFHPAKALEHLDKRRYDLILSDFRMPGMNGQEFHAKVRQKDPVLAQNIIFLTGDTVAEETHTFLEKSGNQHLEKPFQLATLEQVIADLLAKRRSATVG